MSMGELAVQRQARAGLHLVRRSWWVLKDLLR